MSYFDNIVFDENTLLEGEQAEAYKAKKAAEKRAEFDKDYNRKKKRIMDYGARPNETAKKSMNAVEKEVDRKKKLADDAQNKYFEARRNHDPDTKKYFNDARDKDGNYANLNHDRWSVAHAVDRHDRRHPDRKLAEAFEAYNPELIEL